VQVFRWCENAHAQLYHNKLWYNKQAKETENRSVAGIIQMLKVKGEVNNAFRHSNCSAMYD
jgi:hypothetical protein